jgi:hypothetical protein
MKFVPVTVSEKPAPPARAEDGLRLVTVGTGFGGGLTIKKGSEFESPPPGVGLKTVTLAVPAVAMSAARIEAVSRVEETYVVVRSAPFHLTTEPETKFVPLTVRVKADPPAVADEGLRLVVVGTGLLVVKV